jgi:competence protein ComEA
MKLIRSFIFCLIIGSSALAFAGTQVDVNSADARALAQALDGIGLTKAEAIVAYRAAHGPFQTLGDLAKVDGIGPHIIEKNRESIVFGKPHQPPGAQSSPHSLSTW